VLGAWVLAVLVCRHCCNRLRAAAPPAGKISADGVELELLE
jgi:hypothetical protein